MVRNVFLIVLAAVLLATAIAWLRPGKASRDSQYENELADLERLPDREIEKGVRLIGIMLTRRSTEPRLLETAARIHYRRFELFDDPRNLVLSLEYSQAAVEVDRFSKRAQAAKAQALARLGLWQESLEAWDQYLSIETEAAAREAAARSKVDIYRQNWRNPAEIDAELVRLVESGSDVAKIGSSDLGVAQRYAIEMFPGHLARALDSGNPEGIRRWRAAFLSLGELTAKASGDFFLSDLGRSLENAPNDEKLKEALHSFDLGLSAHRQRDPQAAKVQLERAYRYFEKRGPALAAWTELLLLSVAHGENSEPRLESRLLELRRKARQRGYSALEASAEWLLGVHLTDENRIAEGQRCLGRALTLFRQVGWREAAGFLELLLSDSAMLHGSTLQAWRLLRSCLGSVSGFRDAARQQVVWGTASTRALELDARLSAEIFAERGLVAASWSRSAVAMVEALRQTVELQTLGGKLAKARDTYRRASALMANFPEGGGLRARSQLLLTGGRFLDGFGKGSGDLSRGIELLRQAGLKDLLPAMLLERARVNQGEEQDVLAESDLREAAELLESQRLEPLDLEQRSALIETGREVFERWIDAKVRQAANPGEILLLIERFLAFRRQDLPRSRPPLPAELPDQTLVVSYFSLPDRLLIVGSTREGSELHVSPVGRSTILREAHAINKSLEDRDRSVFRTSSRRIWDALIGPVAHLVATRRRLVFQLDPFFGSIPLAALADEKGSYLIASHTIEVAPRWPRVVRPSARPVGRSSILAVGDPEFDQAEFPASELKRLDGAGREAREVAELYQNRRLLLGPDATPEAFLEALRSGPEVVHLASHLVWRSRWADMPQLVLAKGSQGSALTAEQIRREVFQAPPLVFLAACSSASRGTQRSRRFPSIAELFLDHGAGAVVGSTIEIDDGETTAFAVELHRRYRRGERPSEILQEMLRERLDPSGRRLPKWCALQVEVQTIVSE